VRQHTQALAGQLYTDELADNAKARSVGAMATHTRAVRDAIRDAKNYTDLRKRLRRVFAASDQKKLTRLLERALILGELAGRRAIHHEHT
jgi:phage gp29-like protein